MADESILNRVIGMQQQGYSDEQISQILSQEGISPKEVTDSLNKSRIKAAVYQPEPFYPEQYAEQVVQPAAMPLQAQMPQPAAAMPTMPGAPAAEPSQQYYPEYVQGMSTETVSEITEQIVNEKITDLTKNISDISIFKERIEKQVSMLDERLRKIESIIDELKAAIIRKIGEHGENIREMKDEMGMMQDSFSKVMTPLAENVRKLEDMIGKEPTRISAKKPSSKPTTSKTLKEGSFM